MPRTPSSTPDSDNFPGELTPQQRQTYKELQDLLASPSTLLSWHHRVGQVVTGLRDDPDWKHGWFQKLAAQEQTSVSTLRKEVLFAKRFSVQDVRQLDSDGIGWGMITVVLHVEKSKDRMKMLQRAKEQNLGVVQLKKAVQKRYKVRNRGGRPILEPQSVAQAVEQLRTQSNKWLGVSKRRDEWGQLPTGNRPASLRKQLDETIEIVRQVKGMAGEIEETLEELRKKGK